MPAFQASAINRSATSPHLGMRENNALNLKLQALSQNIFPETKNLLELPFKIKDSVMSGVSKFFASLFTLLAILAVGHDIYIWQTSGNPFAFAALGWITKHYAGEEHKTVVETISPENFNIIFTPILSIPLFYSMAGLTVLSLILGYIGRLVRKYNGGTPDGKPAPNKGFVYKRR